MVDVSSVPDAVPISDPGLPEESVKIAALLEMLGEFTLYACILNSAYRVR